MVSVRPAVAGDVEQLIRIARRSATAAQWSRDQYERLFAADPHPHRIVLVVEEQGSVCGFIAGHRVAGEWEIENIAVLPQARRRGLGSRLLNEFLQHANRGGGVSVFLEVRQSNLAARELYEKWGFSEAGRRKNYYQGPPEDAFILRLSLPGRPEI